MTTAPQGQLKTHLRILVPRFCALGVRSGPPADPEGGITSTGFLLSAICALIKWPDVSAAANEISPAKTVAQII